MGALVGAQDQTLSKAESVYELIFAMTIGRFSGNVPQASPELFLHDRSPTRYENNIQGVKELVIKALPSCSPFTLMGLEEAYLRNPKDVYDPPLSESTMF